MPYLITLMCVLLLTRMLDADAAGDIYLTETRPCDYSLHCLVVASVHLRKAVVERQSDHSKSSNLDMINKQ